jgi:hypothetical protein
VVAGAVWSVHLFADWILQQIDPLTASETWLIVWGKHLGVPRKAATTATGTVTLTGAGTIPAGTILHAADQRRYITTLAGLTHAPLAIESVNSGYAGNIPTPTTLTLVNPIAGVSLDASATALTGGLDQESLSTWAVRIAERIKQMQQVGDADDYAIWTKQAHPAIVDAWVEGNTPYLGDITIYCLLASGAVPETVLPAASTALDRISNVGCRRFLRTPETLAVTVRIANVPAAGGGLAVRALIDTDIASLIAGKRARNMYLYPEEIDRIIARHAGDYPDALLLEPIRKLGATGNQIMNLAGVVYE